MSERPPRVLVTGAAGYIGSRLIPRLSAAGCEIVALDRAEPPQLPPEVQFIRADLLDRHACRDALRGCDEVFHLAAAKGDWGISPAEYERDNVDATRSLIEAGAAAGVHRWVFFSTVSVLGPSGEPLGEGAPQAPANPYGATKAKAERLFERLIEERPATRVLTVRPSVVFGPGNPWNTNIYRLIDAIARRRFVMIGAGSQIKTTSYIDNLIDATMHLHGRWKASEAGPPHDVFHCVDEPAITVAELVQHIHRQLGARPSPRLPLWLAAPLAGIGDLVAWLSGIDMAITGARVRKFCTPTNFSAEKLAATGFRPRVTIRQGIDRTIEWHLSKVREAACG